MQASNVLKDGQRTFWNRESCGEVYAQGESVRERLERQAQVRYELEPYLAEFARFGDGAGRDVLEIGVGMGSDHLEWAKSRPRSLTGIDLTPRAIEFARERLALYGMTSDLRVSDAEELPFHDDSFDIVYSWGVIHHSPDTPRIASQIRRVLRPGGVTRIMIYHYHSLVGYMLWLRYGLLAGRPGRSLTDIYASHLQGPGTKAYTVEGARTMFLDAGFSHVDVRSRLGFGDLLEGEVGQRHRGALLRVARTLYPRWLIKRLVPRLGLVLLIEARK